MTSAQIMSLAIATIGYSLFGFRASAFKQLDTYFALWDGQSSFLRKATGAPGFILFSILIIIALKWWAIAAFAGGMVLSNILVLLSAAGIDADTENPRATHLERLEKISQPVQILLLTVLALAGLSLYALR